MRLTNIESKNALCNSAKKLTRFCIKIKIFVSMVVVCSKVLSKVPVFFWLALNLFAVLFWS